MRMLSIIVLLLFYGQLVMAQSPRQVDSLRNLLGKTADDSTRISIQTNMYLAYYDSIPTTAAEIARDMVTKSILSNYRVGVSRGHYFLGHHFVTISNYDSAKYHLKKSLQIGKELDKPNISLNALEWIINIHQKEEKLDSALYYIDVANKIAENSPEIKGVYIARVKMNEGKIYGRKGDVETEVKKYIEAENLLEDVDIDLSAFLKSQIGTAYDKLGEHGKARKYYLEAQAIYEKTFNRNGFYFIETKIGDVEMAAGNHDAALKHYLSAHKHFKSVNKLTDLAANAVGLGKVYLKKRNYALSEKYYREGLDLAERINLQSLIPYSYNGLGLLFRETNNIDTAISYHKKAIEVSYANKNPEYLSDSYSYLLEIYRATGDFKNAFSYQSELVRIKDSLQEKANLVRITEIEEKYQNEKKQQQIELLTSQSELTAQKAKNQRNLFIAGISVLGLAFLSLFILFKNKQRTNKRLKELEAAKSKFFANISHEFRTPLTLISGPVSHQLSKNDLSHDDKTDLGLIQRNASRLLKLVDQILDLSKIEAGRRKLSVSKGNMGLFLKHLVEPFEYQATQKGMVLNNQIDISGEVWFDRDMVEKIVSNLMSNALKYNLDKGKIDFTAKLQGQSVVIKVGNENIDLTEKELPQIFNRFYQSNALKQGFGIGLSLVKELVNLSHGTIKAHKPDAGTIQFLIILPVSKNTFSEKELTLEGTVQDFQKSNEVTVFDLNIKEEGLEDSSLPVLLVVDDNDEIRLFTKTLFKKEYRILEAENGEEGVNIALKTIPDLIISDIMMPVKDGIYLSNTLKSDERTSHIPIVLLTAKSGEENELKGLKAGADAYMVKPFKEEKLRVIIKKLIALRETIREKLNKQIILKPKEIELGSADTMLLDRIGKVLEERLTDPEFNAQSFSEQVGLSRMHLHRKLKALTGFSTSEFIRLQRLKLAAKLLKEGHDNISEIGYAVGFNQPTYFSTAFKQHFGCSPTEYVIT